jgi:hypothetical protein
LVLGLTSHGTDPRSTEASGKSKQPPARITQVAYTLKRDSDESLVLAITDPAGKIDTKALEADFARLSVPVRVYTGDPNCVLPAQPSSALSGQPQPEPSQSSSVSSPGDGSYEIERVDGKLALRVRPAMIPDGYVLTVAFPLAATAPEMALGIMLSGVEKEEEVPACYPALTPDMLMMEPSPTRKPPGVR